MTTEEEIKLRLFESIAGNSQNLCDDTRYMSPQSVAHNVNDIYNILFIKRISYETNRETS